MVYTPFVPDKPVIADNGDIVINNTRENLMALRDAVVAGALKGWNFSKTGTAEPTEILYSKGTERVRLTITWGTTGGADGNPTVVIYAYSANSGGLYDTIGTNTLAYDSSGNLVTETWS